MEPVIVRMTSDHERFAEAVGPYLGSAALAEELDGEVADRPGKVWTALLAGEGGAVGPALGFCAAVDTGADRPVEIETYWLHEVARGRGYGRRLLAETLDAYPGRALHAWCSTSSRELFAAAGFREVQEAPPGEVPWWAEVVRDA